jgi:hypothetical protein
MEKSGNKQVRSVRTLVGSLRIFFGKLELLGRPFARLVTLVFDPEFRRVTDEQVRNQ